MKKKVLAIMLSVAMVAALFVGCGSSDSGDTEEPAAEAEGEEEPAAEAGGVGDIIVGLIVNTTCNDGGFCEAQYLGVLEAMEQLGMDPDSQLIPIEGVAEEPVATTNAVEELVDEGCNLIMGGSTGYAPILTELALEYPEVQFCQVGVPVENCVTYHIRAYDSMYAIGYMCALMSETDELGYVAGMSEASVRFSINAFALGAKAANEKATVKLVWANSWYDPAAEGEAAKALAADGITYIGSGTTSPGVPEACSAAGVFCTGYDLDKTDYAPDAVLVSCIWNWGPIFANVFQTFADGGLVPYVDSYFDGASVGAAALSAYNADLVPADVQEQTNAIYEKIANGEINVFAGKLLDNQGNVIVEEGEVLSDELILDQNFLVENVIGTF